ncbi:hypothetical protein [Caldiplasma sukawensis]
MSTNRSSHIIIIVSSVIGLLFAAISLAFPVFSIKETSSGSIIQVSQTFNLSFFNLSYSAFGINHSVSIFSKNLDLKYFPDIVLASLVILILSMVFYLIQVVYTGINGNKMRGGKRTFAVIGMIFGILSLGVYYAAILYLINVINSSNVSYSYFPSIGFYFIIVSIIGGIIATIS